MKNKIIVANWKMNPRTLSEARAIFHSVKRTARGLSRVQTIICPPFIFLDSLASKKTNAYALGAQDAFWENTSAGGGAYTGEISPAQLSALGVSYVILGHSERRALGETDEMIQKKLKAAIEYRLTVILCIGEKERDARGEYLMFLKDELKKSIGKISTQDFRRLIVAYEPIWAVGAKAKKADTPEALLETVIFIRKVLNDIYGAPVAFQVPILYGGSVHMHNARAFMADGGVSGLLVGRASLDPKEFSEILKRAQEL